VNNNETAVKRRRKIKITHILILLFVAVVFAFALFRLSVRIKFQNRIKAIRDAGYPVTLTEMNELYKIPEGVENAADTYIEAFLSFHELNQEERESLPIFNRSKLPARTEPLAQETKKLLAQYLADNKQTLEFLHKAASIKHCRYPVDFTNNLGHPMYHLGDSRNCSILLKLEAIFHAENNNSQLAARSVMSNFSLARSLAKEPTSFSQSIRIICQRFAVQSIERIINRTELTDESLLQFSEMLREAEDISSIILGLAGERCRGIYVFKNPTLLTEEFVGENTLPAPVFEIYSALGLGERDGIVYLDFVNEYIDYMNLPMQQYQRASETMEAKLRKVSKTHILFNIFSPRYYWIMRSYSRNIAQVRAARVGIAVQRYRLSTGNLPDTLEDLVPVYLDTIPEDPYDGQALRYSKLETGFVVYSIGSDKIDDGGREQVSGGRGTKKPSSWDITFIVER
jgi:hypothetical protein